MRHRSMEEWEKYFEEVYGIKVDEKMAKEMREESELGMFHYNRGKEDGRAEVLAESIAEGKTEGKIATTIMCIKNVMESFNMTLKEAMDGLKVPKSERAYYEEKIKESEEE